jgi:predicted permease
VDTLLKDIRYAVRTLAKARGFAVVAVLTLALGIGATTAMFSVVNAVLLRPLPFRQPEGLVALGEFNTQRQAPEIPRGSFSYPELLDVRQRNHSFESVALYSSGSFTLTGAGAAVHVNSDNVSAGLFQMLGVQPVLGRSFLPSEDDPGHHVAILANEFWRGFFHSDPNVVGRSVNLNGRSFTIVGVMPAGFQFPIRETPRDVWVTFSLWAESDNPKDPPLVSQRGAHSGQTIARLRPGVTLAQANVDLASIARQLSAEFPKQSLHTGMAASREIDYLLGKTKTPLLVLFGAVGLVLLIACANVANLLLARSSARSAEIAIRAALGASRARIVRQLVTEALVLSLSGALMGVGIAIWALSAIVRFYPANLPRAEQVGIDLPVLLFTMALGIGTGLLFGLAPAMKASVANLTEAMREGRTMTAAGAQTHWRSALVVCEVAMGVMLLIGAGLLLRSLNRLTHADLGFNPEHVLTANFDLSDTGYDPDKKVQFISELMERTRALPGVVHAAAALPMPLDRQDGWSVAFNFPDHPVPESSEPEAQFYIVQPGFFETMQMSLVRGRTFDKRDQRNSDPVVVVTASFASKFFPNEDPIGKHVIVGAGDSAARKKFRNREIIGVVGDVRNSDIAQAPIPTYYMPMPQLMWGTPTLIVRTAGDPTAITGALRKTLADMDPEAPLYEPRTLVELLALDLGRARFQAILLAIFALVALVLTAVGLYGVMAYSVAQRTHEIGVRMALGASRNDVLAMVLRRGVVLTVAGIAAGIVGALALAKVIESLLYQVPPRDPATYVVVVLTLGTVALLASFLPAMRATKVDPMVALRYE